MIDIKADFSGGLNLDDALYNVPKNAYIDAMNVTTDAIEGSNDKAITNIVGNRLVEYDFPTVSLFSSVSSFTTENTYTALILTGNVIPNTNIIVYLKKQNNQIIVIGNYTTVSGDDIVSIYNALANSIMMNVGEEVISADVAGDQTLLYLRIEHTSTSSISNDNVQISSFNQGENVCIGAFPNNVTNTVIYFVWNSIGFHTVLEYNNTSRTISPIFINLTDSNNVDILNFDRNKKITSINIYNRDEDAEDGGGDLLFFLDSLGRPTTMDIKRFKDGEYKPVTRDILDVCKRPPLFPPDVLYGNDSDIKTNNLRNRLFRFKYRYVYDNNEKSVCSPISTLPLPINILDEEYNSEPSNNNKIDIQLNTGDKDVKSIELLMSYVLKSNDWSDFALVENIIKNDIFLKSTYTTQGTENLFEQETIIKFTGVVIPGTVIQVKLRQIFVNQIDIVAEYTTAEGDAISNVVNGLVADAIAKGLVATASNDNGSLRITYSGLSYYVSSIDITSPSGAQNDNLSFIYSFYNDGTYPVIDIAESTQIFDYVPDLANAQEMANGNVLIYGGITEGYDRNLQPNVVNDILTIPGGGSIGSFGATVWYSPKPYTVGVAYIYFNGIPIEGTVINIYLKDNDIVYLVGTYTTVKDDSIQNVRDNLKISLEMSPYVYYVGPTNNFLNFSYQWSGSFQTEWDSITITPPDFDSTNNSIPTFLFSSTRRLGIAYFDKKGKTNGILYSDKLVFPKYEESEEELLEVPYINTKVYHTPPEWAHSYGFYLTKEATQFLYWQSIKLEEDNDNNDFLYFNITNLGENQKLYPTTTQVLSYNFQDGDRLRLIKRISETENEIYTIDYDAAIIGVVKDPSGVALAGTYVKIKKTPPFDNLTYEANDNFIIQLYRPTQQLPTGINEVYYEFGQQYGIGNPGTPTRYHLGMTQDQGIVPMDVINCNVSEISIGGIDVSTIAFDGVPFAGTQININITQLPSTTITLASYNIQSTDTLTNVIDNLLSQLSIQVGTYLTGASKDGDNINISYSNLVYSFSQSSVVFTYPATNTIPAEFNFYGGDVYVRPRTICTNDGISSFGFATYNTLDRNFVDDYISAVNNIEGRPSIIDVNARKAYYSTMVRFGQAYQPNTNINGLNRFFPANFDEYDYSYGDIMRLKVRDRFIRVFQKLKVGKVPLYSQIVKDPSNVQNLIVSDKLINPIAYYVGDLGIGEHAESLASYTFADYFTSNIKGIIARVGEEGVSFLSIDNKMDSWATSNLPLRTGDYKVYGGLDQRLGNYIMALEAVGEDPIISPAVTLVFDLDLKCFSTFLSYHPEMMTTLGTLFISFKDGKLYTHDNFDAHNTFYGEEAADSTITPVFNANPLDKKTFMSVGEVASQIWDIPVIKTDLNSYGNIKMESNLVDTDFNELEGTYEAAILRDKNSIGGVLEGDSMKGKYMTMKFRAKAPTSLVSLNLLSLKSINSPLNNR